MGPKTDTPCHNLIQKKKQSDHQGIHTNNYTESWHRVLKTSYLPHTERLRIDEVVQILTDDVKLHYRWAQIQVGTGFAWQTTNKFQQRQKLLAESYLPTEMEMLGIACVKENEEVGFPYYMTIVATIITTCHDLT